VTELKINEHERILLASMLLDDDCLHRGIKDLTAMHFTVPDHRTAFTAMTTLLRNGEVVDEISLGSHLNDWKLTNKITENIETSFHFDNAKQVIELNYEKLALSGGLKSIQIILESEYTNTTKETISSTFFETLKKCEKTTRNHTLLEIHKKQIKTLENYHEDPKKFAIDKLFWPIKAMNERFQAIKTAEFVAIGARPSIGKTSFVSQLAIHNAQKGKRIVLYSLETPVDEMVQNIVVQITQKPLQAFFDFAQNMDDYVKAIDQKISNNLIIEDSVRSLNAIIQDATIKNLQNAIDCVIIDYLQLIQSDKSYSREREIALISRTLREFTISTEIPVIVLCQLGREVEKDGRLPKLSDFRESGAIEQDATRCLFLCRPEKSRSGSSQKEGEYTGPEYDHLILQRKCRNGPKAVNHWSTFFGPTKTYQ